MLNVNSLIGNATNQAKGSKEKKQNEKFRHSDTVSSRQEHKHKTINFDIAKTDKADFLEDKESIEKALQPIPKLRFESASDSKTTNLSINEEKAEKEREKEKAKVKENRNFKKLKTYNVIPKKLNLNDNSTKADESGKSIQSIPESPQIQGQNFVENSDIEFSPEKKLKKGSFNLNEQLSPAKKYNIVKETITERLETELTDRNGNEANQTKKILYTTQQSRLNSKIPTPRKRNKSDSKKKLTSVNYNITSIQETIKKPISKRYYLFEPTTNRTKSVQSLVRDTIIYCSLRHIKMKP